MDRLRTMGSFVQVVRSGSFTRAARRLGLSNGLVSRHVADLETHLGIRLLDRSTRSFNVTEEGRTYLEFCETMFRQIEDCEQSLRGKGVTPRGSLSIVAPKSFGCLNLADAVVAFASEHPQIRVSLTLEDLLGLAPYDFMERGFDLALRMATLSDSGLIARRVCSLDWVICASPDYFERAGQPRDPAELAKHQCLVQTNLSPNDRVWKFRTSHGMKSIKVGGRFNSNSTLVIRKAAIAGIGLALLPRYCVASDLLDGKLVRLTEQFAVELIQPRPLLAIYAKGAPVSQKLRLFIASLTKWFKVHDPNLGY